MVGFGDAELDQSSAVLNSHTCKSCSSTDSRLFAREVQLLLYANVDGYLHVLI